MYLVRIIREMIIKLQQEQAKNSGQLNLVTEGGNSIPNEATKDIPDLDPTLVKAVTVQESNAGTTGLTDIMQANVPGDWSKMKSSYQLSKEKRQVKRILYMREQEFWQQRGLKEVFQLIQKQEK